MKIITGAALLALGAAACGGNFAVEPRPTNPNERPAIIVPAAREPDPAPVTAPARATPGSCRRQVEPVSIGGLAVLTGPGATFSPGGEILATAIEQASDDPCRAPLEASVRDTGGDADRAVSFARAFARSGVPILADVQGAAVTAALVAAGVPAAERIPVLTAGADPDEHGRRWVFPIGARGRVTGAASIAHGVAGGAKRFVIVSDGSPFAEDLVAGAERAAGQYADAKVLTVDDSPGGHGIYDLACEQGCDATIVALGPSRAGAWFASEPPPPRVMVILHEGLLQRASLDACAAMCEGAVAFSSLRLPLSARDPLHAEFVAAFGPERDPVDVPLLRSWVSARIAIEALGLVDDSATGPGVRRVLASTSFPVGLTAEPLSWEGDRSANRAVRPYVLRIGDGGMVQVEPAAGWYTEPA